MQDFEQAFPSEGGEFSGLHPHPGMSLRDYFAGQALIGICTSCGFQGGPWLDIARDAYRAADAMLIQGKETSSSEATPNTSQENGK